MQRPTTFIDQLAGVEREPYVDILVEIVPDGGLVPLVTGHDEHREKGNGDPHAHLYLPARREMSGTPRTSMPTITEVVAPSNAQAAATSFAAFADGCRSGDARVTASSKDVLIHSSARTRAMVIASTAHSS